jgi:PAS domain S-box-containing protein
MKKLFSIFIKKMWPNRILFLQIAFTIFAFLMMVIISYLIMNTAIRSQLSRNSAIALDHAMTKIEVELRGPETTLRTLAEGAQQRIIQGADVDNIRELLRSFNSYLLFHTRDGTTPVTLFGIFYTIGTDPVFLHNDGWTPYAGYDERNRPWYRIAMAGSGTPGRSEIYLDFSVEQYVFAIAQSIHDESGRLLGIVSLQIPIELVGDIVIQTAEEQGGYGMIIGQDMKVYSHANHSFEGMYVPDPILPFSIFHNNFLKGEDIFEHPIIAFTGEASLAFFRKTQDGWYYGTVVPRAPYFKSITNIWYILVALGSAAAVFLIFMLVSTDNKKNKVTALTNALNKMSEIFITQSGKSFDDTMSMGGELIADIAEIDRLSILRNTVEDGDLYMSQVYRWEKASGGTTKINNNFVHVAYKQIAPVWERMFMEGKSLSGPARLMPEREAALLKSLGTLSAFLAPIYINGAPWGFVLFEDQKKERAFRNELAETMKSAAFLIANAIVRAELEDQIASERDFTQKIIDAAPIALNILDENYNLISCNDAVENIFGCTKQYYFDNFLKFSPEYQPDGVKSIVKAKELLNQGRIGEAFVSEWEHCSATGEPIPCEVTQTNVIYNNKQVELLYIYDLRNLKKMEKTVVDAERTQALMDAVPLSCTLIDKNLNVLTCNKTAVEFFGLTKKDDIQHLFVDLMPDYQPDGNNSEEVVTEAIKKAFDVGYLFNPDWMHRNMDGELLPSEVTLVRVEYGNDQVIAAYARDIRAVKEAEAKAKEADERAHLMVEYAPLVVMLWDKNLQILDCNQEVVRIFGVTSKQEYIDKFFSLAPEFQPNGGTSLEVAQKALMQGLETGYGRLQWVLNHAVTGESIPFDATLARVQYKGEDIVISYALDMRERNAAIDKMRESDERAQILFDIAPLAGCMFNKNIRMLDCNQEIVKMFGLPNKETFLKRHSEFIPEYQPDGTLSTEVLARNIQTAFEEGYYFFEFMHRKFSGEPLPVKSTLLCIKYRGEDVIAAYLSDLTEQKAMVQLAKQQAEAEAANRAKSSFLATMSHEIRTPMNAILGITEIQLQDKKLLTNTRDALNIIYNSGYSLLGIINDLLDLSKIESGKLELIDDRYETASLIHDTINLNTARIGSKPIEFKLNVDEALPFELIGDELRVKQILNNLLSNAFKYTDSGEVNLSFSAETNNKKVTLSIIVGDTGQGMTEEQLKNLFDAYSRFNLQTNRFVEGTGLGMNIVQHLVNMMGGDIFVDSTPGVGTKVTVHLRQGYAGPAMLGSEVVESLKGFRMAGMSKVKKAQIVREYMPYGKVLVVDDMETNLYVAKGFLMPYELKVETAMSGIEVLKRIERGDEYDIVFMDHMMPVMDGIETAKALRAKGYTKPIIALTANAVAGQADMFMANGFDGFISKPIDIRELNASLNKFVRDKQPPEVVEAARSAYGNSVVSDMYPQLDPELARIFTNDAEKATAVLQGYETRGTYESENLQMYITNVHALKSALANIGETKLSDQAKELERAGREKETAFISDETPKFLKGLRALVDRLKLEMVEHGVGEVSEDDLAYMRKTLTAVKEACAEYNIDAAMTTLAELKQKQWPGEYGELLNTISEHLLHSEFDEAEAVCAAQLSDG